MPLACPFEALDPDTRDYLQGVRRRQGRNTPGVFAPDGDPQPWLAVVAGVVLGTVLFVLSLDSTKGPLPTAMLQTAAVLLGGWPLWFAVRRFASGNSSWYGGKYKYFDPLNVYQVRGERVQVDSLESVREVAAGGRPGGGVVRFDLGDRELFVPVKSAALAKEVEDYYAAMADLEGRPDGRWANADAGMLGLAARELAESGEEPRWSSDRASDAERVPTAPAVTRRAGWGFGGLLLLLGAAAGLFLAFWAVNVPLGDEWAFERAKQGGAPGLRAYLLDPANTGHRDEAKRLLAAAYDLPISRLKAAPPGAKPELRAALVQVLETLRTSDSPVVSIRVTEDREADAPDTATPLRAELADGIARSVGPELIAFVAPPDDKPAHLTVKYQFRGPKADPDDDRPPGPVTAAVTVEVRPDLDKPPAGAAAWAVPLRVNAGLVGVQRLDLLKQELARELVGEWKPAPLNLGGGGF